MNTSVPIITWFKSHPLRPSFRIRGLGFLPKTLPKTFFFLNGGYFRAPNLLSHAKMRLPAICGLSKGTGCGPVPNPASEYSWLVSFAKPAIHILDIPAGWHAQPFSAYC